MRLLFLTPQLPYPPHKGTTMRNFNFIQRLADRHEVHLLSFVTANIPHESLRVLSQLCAGLHTVGVPRRSLLHRLGSLLFSTLPDMAHRLPSRAFASTLRSLLKSRRFDVVQIEGIELAQYMSIVREFSEPAIVFDEHNCEYLLQKSAFETEKGQASRLHGASYSFLQWQRLVDYERRACQQADAVVAVSEEDRLALLELDGRLDISVIPNGVDVDFYRRWAPETSEPSPDPDPTLLFLGTMDFRPNVDAMLWFCREILPLIRSEEPSTRLLIVGNSPVSAIRKLSGPRVAVMGEVPDIRPFLSQAHLTIAPLRMGGGSRFKILESMAAGVPVVSTLLGAAGIAGEDGKGILLADEPKTFAKSVVDLLRDPQRRSALAAQALTLVEERYDWKRVVPHLEMVYQRAMATRSLA